MIDIYFLIELSLLFFVIGFPISRLLPSSIFKLRGFTAPTLGYGITALVTTLLYKWGVSIPVLFRIFAGTCAALMLFLLIDLYKKNKKNIKIVGFYTAKKNITICFLIWLIGTGILLAPKLTGGNQFAVFQGNHWDTFGYLNSAVVYSKEPYRNIINSSTDDWIRNPLIAHAKENLQTRPSVHILYSLVGQMMPHHYHALYYTFLIFFFSQFILVTIFLLMNSFKAVNPVLCGIVALAFPLGFWGQYILDINAWSQISSLPILLLLVALQILILTKYYDKIEFLDALKLLVLFTLLFASSLYLYPESLIFHLPAIAIIICISFMIRSRRNCSKSAVFIIILALLSAGLTGLFFYSETVGHIVSQLKTVNFPAFDWWKYFLAFLQGQDLRALLQGLDPHAFSQGIQNFRDTPLIEILQRTSLFENIIDTLAGVSGLYFLTPCGNQSILVNALIRSANLLFIISILSVVLAFILRLSHLGNQFSSKHRGGGGIILIAFTIIMLSSSLAYTLIFKTTISLFIHDFTIILIISLLIFILMKKLHLKISSHVEIQLTTKHTIMFFAVVVAIMSFLMILLLIQGQFWGAGKALTYVCPYVFILIAMAYFSLTAARTNLLPKLILLAFMFIQISFGVIRIPQATSFSGIHYSFPYPSVQSRDLKEKNDWEIDNINQYVKESRPVLIDVKSPWLENYLMVYLYSIGKDVFTANIINTYFGMGDDIGYQKIPEKGVITITDRPKMKDAKKLPKEKLIQINRTLRVAKTN